MLKLIDDDTLAFLAWVTRYYRFAAHAHDRRRIPLARLRPLYRRKLSVAQAHTALTFVAHRMAHRPN